jgi:hypothetical protein
MQSSEHRKLKEGSQFLFAHEEGRPFCFTAISRQYVWKKRKELSDDTTVE